MIAIGVVAVGEVFALLGLIIAGPILSLIVILAEALWINPRETATMPVPPVAGTTTADEGRASV